MSLEAVHPLYDVFKDDWSTQRDLYQGERVVKAKDEVYLPATPSMHLDGMSLNQIGYTTYQGYKKRAVFPEYVRDAVEALTGMLNHKPATIELPEVMEPLRKSCTLTGESLNDVLRNIHSEQLITGRIGVLADLPVSPDPTKTPLPYLALYIAESIKNWDDASDSEGYIALNLVVLDESGQTRGNDFIWKSFKKFRVLQLGDININETVGAGVYAMGVFSNANGGSLEYNAASMQPPMLRGKTLDEIPFVFINTRDLVSAPDVPPLIGLGKNVLAIYRGEADYRQSLFMTGQDTLVVIGGTREPDGTAGDEGAIRTGAGSRIDVDMQGDAKYIGVNSEGLAEQRECLVNDRKRAEQKAGQLIPAKNSQESGEALKTRITAQTASLKQIALTSAKGLETMLKVIARWMGADEEKVVVTANTEFGEFAIDATDITGLMGARTMGAPISKKSIHTLLSKRGYTDMTYEDEMELIQEEDAAMPRVAAGAGVVTAEEQLLQQEKADKQKEKEKKPAPGKTEE